MYQPRGLWVLPGYSNIIGDWLTSCGWSRVSLAWTTGLCSTCAHFLWQSTCLNSLFGGRVPKQSREMHRGCQVHCHSHHTLLATARKHPNPAQTKGGRTVSTTWWGVLHTSPKTWLQRKMGIWGHRCKQSLIGVNFNLKDFISPSTFSSGMISEKTVRLNHVSTDSYGNSTSKGQDFLQM